MAMTGRLHEPRSAGFAHSRLISRDILVVSGLNPGEGFSIYWKQGQVAGPGQTVALIDKSSGRLLTWVKDTDSWRQGAQGGSFRITFPAGTSVNLSG